MTKPHLRILVVDEDAQRGATLAAVLRVTGYEVVEWSDTQVHLTRLVTESKPDVVLINLTSPDRDTLEQLTQMRDQTPRPVVMFAQDDEEQTIQSAVRAGVSAYIVDGLSTGRVKPIIDVAVAHFRQHQAVREELEKAKNTLGERQYVDRAKALLMRQRNIPEPEAYALLRKLAMDRKERIGQVAQQVIAAAELLEGVNP